MNAKKLVLIDSDFLKFYATYPIKKYYSSTEFNLIDKTLVQVIESVDKWMKEIFKETQATHYIGALTVGKCFRYQVFPEYKANRKGLTKPLYYKEVEDYLIDKYNCVFKIGYEADDIVNICKVLYKDTYECIIASNDQDILSLEGTHYNTTKKVWVSTDKQKAQYEFWKDMITGQPGDGIKGLPGKGDKFASILLDDITSNNIMCSLVFGEFTSQFGVNKGIEEFVKTYKCLRLLEESEEIHFIPQEVK